MTSHLSASLLDAYAAGDTGIGADLLWAVEAHLEKCAACRDRLGSSVARRSRDTTVLLERIRVALDRELAASPRMPARRTPNWAKIWATPTLLTRLGMTVLVVLAALGLDLADGLSTGSLPPVVLLVAPIVPLLGVAAIWSTGLYLVLRRTLAVLLVVIPALAAAGALALGEVVGLHRAASGLVLGWAALVVAPSLITAELPVLLEPASLPVWAGLTAAVAVVLVVRRNAYTALGSGR